jgi:hypothetical protein
MAKKADEVKKALGMNPISKEEAQNLYSGKEPFVPSKEEEPKGNKKTVIGIVEAEKLQKAGWTLISATRPTEDPFGNKEYKFERNK